MVCKKKPVAVQNPDSSLTLKKVLVVILITTWKINSAGRKKNEEFDCTSVGMKLLFSIFGTSRTLLLLLLLLLPLLLLLLLTVFIVVIRNRYWQSEMSRSSLFRPGTHPACPIMLIQIAKQVAFAIVHPFYWICSYICSTDSIISQWFDKRQASQKIRLFTRKSQPGEFSLEYTWVKGRSTPCFSLTSDAARESPLSETLHIQSCTPHFAHLKGPSVELVLYRNNDGNFKVAVVLEYDHARTFLLHTF